MAYGEGKQAAGKKGVETEAKGSYEQLSFVSNLYSAVQPGLLL